jgi:DNA-binding NarL/FixJ family response regulator
LADDNLARSGLAAALAREPGLVIAGQWSTHDATFARSVHPQAGVWDLGTAQRGEVESLDAGLAFPVLALIADPSRAGSAVLAGARGVAFRDATASRLAAALYALVAGYAVFEESLAPEFLHALPRTDGGSPLEALTPREIEVLQLLARGWSNRQIAASLQVSEHTAKFHVNAILGKLGAAGRTEAVVRAARMGLVVL